MDVRVRGHSAGSRKGSDYRLTVTYRDESLAVPLSIHFVDVVDNETGERELRNVGIELGEPLRDEETAVNAPELTALTLRRVVERYPHWLELARAHAKFNVPVESDPKHMKRQKPARLDPDWYRMIAEEYRHHLEDGDPRPVTTIAGSHGVSLSAASRWVKAARERGLIDG
jgi:hypothetical protein